ncbi:acyltransferase [Gracilibacillus sp. YIM 98692]|uniref:acyltransferase n=1 Tax=Gracilibacillus sp. YIM 98692 TaxID=2663532 RepID=UPI0013D842F3|nr:acyltransferase [Gracilibacillus sp. YIM 98692]
MKKTRIESIYILRLTAMLMVVLVHTVGVYNESFDVLSGAFQKYHFLSRMIRVEAGIFILLTGLVFFFNYAQKEWNKASLIDYYKKRAMFIVVPYLIWALIYEWYAHVKIDRELIFSEVVSRILQGESYYQLYFIFIIVQIYLVLPLFVWATQNCDFVRKYLWIIGIVLHLIYIFIQNTFDLSAHNLFFNKISLFLLGGWIGLHYLKEKEKASKWIPTAVIGVIALGIGSVLFYLHYAGYTLNQIQVYSPVYKLTELGYLVLGSYFFFKLSEKITSRLSTKHLGKLKHVAVYSFGYYLIHPLVLKEVAGFTTVRTNYWFHFDITVRYVLTVVLCFVIIWLTHRFVPFAQLFFGKLPARRKKEIVSESHQWSMRNSS